MEDGASQHVEPRAPLPPPPPEPRANSISQPVDPAFSQRSDQPLKLDSEQWDITALSGLGALRMLVQALQDLADTMGDVPPTPPVSRPTTPSNSAMRRQSAPEDTCSMVIGSPEAHPHEPITVEVGVDAEETTLQRIAIARRFFSKTAPAFTVAQYLQRLYVKNEQSP